MVSHRELGFAQSLATLLSVLRNSIIFIKCSDSLGRCVGCSSSFHSICPSPYPSPPTPTEEVPLLPSEVHVNQTLSLMVQHLLRVLHHQPPSWATSAASPSLPGLFLISKTSTDLMHLKNTTQKKQHTTNSS